MLFNSLQFFQFFALLYIIYISVSHKWQNRLLLVGSYFFYGCWDWRFLSLILISTVIDYFAGLKITTSQNKRHRKLFVSISVVSNLAILGIFKYFDFFASSLQSMLAFWGLQADIPLLNIILPVGISFYTFQTMSYTLDIYRGTLQPTRRFLDFALFVAFFPQLVAGPIERASHLLPQILTPRKLSLEKFYTGSFLILWGLFLKLFIADNLAYIADAVFIKEEFSVGMTVLLGVYAFAFQIFCDFAGYSNIARGLGRCMGFDIMINFRIPYIAASPQEFWRRWHISLSTWLRDYLYIPLGGSRKGGLITYRNLLLTMILGGMWHGAAMTFVVWGIYHGLLLCVYRLIGDLFDRLGGFLKFFKWFSNIYISKVFHFIKIVLFFHFVCLGWIFFRATSLQQALDMIYTIFFKLGFMSYFKLHSYYFQNIGFKVPYLRFLLTITPLLIIQAFQYPKKDILFIFKWPVIARAIVYFVLFYLIVIFGVNDGQSFIYFQF